MPNYRRAFMEGATYFITVVTFDRLGILAEGMDSDRGCSVEQEVKGMKCGE